MEALNNGGQFLIQVVLGMVIFMVTLRLLLQWVGASYYNPICQGLVKLTNPLVGIFRRFIPTVKGFDFGIFVVIFLLEIIRIVALLLLQGAGAFDPVSILIFTAAEILDSIIKIFFYAIIIQVVLSWLQLFLNSGYQLARSPIAEILTYLTEPLLMPFRKMLPDLGGIDISPIFAIILLKFTDIVLIGFLRGLA